MLTVAEANAIAGGLSSTTKMPGWSYSIPAKYCNVGSKLHQVEGTICRKCYALRNNYNYPNVRAALERRYQSLTHPQWEDAMVALIEDRRAKYPEPRAVRIDGKSCTRDGTTFRWHDSGDLQGVWHLERIAAVCRRTPNVRHYLPTREYRVVKDYQRMHGALPENLALRLSAHMVDGPVPDITDLRSGKPIPKAYVVRTGEPGKWDKERGAFGCIAPKQENTCGKCRACWKNGVAAVAYHLH